MQRSSESIAKLAAALAKAQGELINPEKSLTATIKTSMAFNFDQTHQFPWKAKNGQQTTTNSRTTADRLALNERPSRPRLLYSGLWARRWLIIPSRASW
jgi:hypothetical protein